MLHIEVKNNSHLKYQFTGNLSMSEVQAMYEQLKDLEETYAKHDFLIKDVEHLDLSFFQLLYAYLKKIKALDKEVAADFQLGEENDRIFQRSGVKEAIEKLLTE
jgi:hypothetical protein